MTVIPRAVNKTISRTDLELPEVAGAARALNQLGRQLWWRRIPYAVNGALRLRFKGIRWNKLWEYARGLAYGDFQPGMRVLDFGGGATIPLFYLARQGCDVFSLDINQKLVDHTNAVARQMNWRLEGSAFDLTAQDAPAKWGSYDRIISFCVIEHIPPDGQSRALARLAGLLKPGGLLELTFDYGAAPTPTHLPDERAVAEVVAATGLTLLGDGEFHDTGERFRLDKKYPHHHFTFGSVFLKKS